MPTELGPWAIFAGFVVSLIGFVFYVLRSMTKGRLVQGVVYDDVIKEREDWKKAAQTALSTSAENAANMGRLVAAVEQLTATARETQQMVRQLVLPAAPERAA